MMRRAELLVAQRLAVSLVIASSIGATPALAQCTGAACVEPSPAISNLKPVDPSNDRVEARLNGTPWIAQSWAYVPFALTPTDTSVSMRASAQHLSGYGNGIIARRYDAAKELAPGLVMPKPAVASPAGFDVWSRVDVNGVGEADRHETKGLLGADYKIAKSALFGISAIAGEDATLDRSGQNYGLAAYAALRPAVPLAFDARAAWFDEAATVGEQDLAGSRSTVSAKVSGKWSFDSVKFTPVVSLSQETESAALAAGGTKTETSRIAVEPRISRPFDLDGGGRIEPFVSFKGEVDVRKAEGEGAQVGATDVLGAGVTLANPESFTMTLTTQVEKAVRSEEQSVNGRLQFKIPLR